MLLISIGVQTWYRRVHTRGLKAFLHILAFVGVFVHEVAHYAFNVLFGVKTGKVKVKYRSEDKMRVAPHGSVGLPEFERNSFLQTFVGSVAPLFVSTFLFLFCVDIIFNIQTDAWVNVVAIVFCVSLFIGSEPSGQDMKLIGETFKRDPKYSIYQIALVVASGLIVWFFVDLYFIYLPFEVLYYIEYFFFVILVYFVLKTAFWIISSCFSALKRPKFPSIKLLTRRRRFKMFAPRKLKEKEAQW
ncbi:MAG: hypothetical protein CEE42_04500 [Promethearchaeota archaeon Loki_b31]|nr:MAG: hypothetical protein CEE42_04500 [Candidatus Lokiarchaeota archaeon Loki_b31]